MISKISLFLLLTVVFTVFNMGNTSTSSVPGIVQEIDTHLGKVVIRIVGDNSPGKIPVICIPGLSASLVDEWTKVAVVLEKHGYVSAIIHFQSNPKTAPALIFGGIQHEDVSKIINEAVLKNVFNSEKAIILGKSWGGYMAFTHATNHPDKVIKLALQAPAFSNSERVAALRKTGIPTFLTWARDDPIVWYSTSKLWREEMGSDLTFYAAETGGHAVVHEYAEPILKFLQA